MSALHLADAAATEALGGALARVLPALPAGRAALVTLHGPLGAGKTTLARGLLRALGVTGRVRSPSYTLVEPYRSGDGVPVHHVDLYRIAEPGELDMLGIREVLGSTGLCLVEWPERAGEALPSPDLVLRLSHAASGRDVALVAASAWGEAWLQALLHSAAAAPAHP